jgi:A/G-specific adenine glycosylase
MNDLQRALLNWYKVSGRHHLPWRQTRDPYCIVVSEFMLQQTQVDRVLPKYEAFIERFPGFETLAGASTADVLRHWKGLGYNSRAVRLKQLAQAVVDRFGGRMPQAEEDLQSLPGVGPYTVAAIRAFAFNIDDAAIDTNVRRVVHRVLYGLEHPPAATGKELDAQAHAIVPPGRAHDWNSAMMDLGSSSCTARAPKCLLCPLQALCKAAPIDAVQLEDARGKHMRKPAAQNAIPFEQTTRYARGRIIDRLRELPPGKRISLMDLHRDVTLELGRTEKDLGSLLSALNREGLVHLRGGRVSLQE